MFNTTQTEKVNLMTNTYTELYQLSVALTESSLEEAQTAFNRFTLVDLYNRNEAVGEKYDAYRDEWAMSLSPDGREAIVNHLRQGGALLGLHTASICFSDWPLWGDILGGSWQWGASWHPAPEQIRLTPTAHPLMRGISVFEVVDELYTELSVSPEVETLITGSSASLTGDNPLLWIHRYGGGRVVYDAMGHDAAAIQQAEHAKVLRQSVAWALGIERAA